MYTTIMLIYSIQCNIFVMFYFQQVFDTMPFFRRMLSCKLLQFIYTYLATKHIVYYMIIILRFIKFHSL